MLLKTLYVTFIKYSIIIIKRSCWFTFAWEINKKKYRISSSSPTIKRLNKCVQAFCLTRNVIKQNVGLIR